MSLARIFGLLACSAIVTMVFSVNASATTITDSTGSSTPTIHAINEPTHVILHNSFRPIECQSTLKGVVPAEKEGGTGKTVSVPLTDLTFSGCTNDWEVHVVSMGSLEIHYLATQGTHNTGTLTSTGLTITATWEGFSCSYRTNETDIGKITGGTQATVHIEASIPRHAGSFLCGGSAAAWTGNYLTTETLKVDP